MAQSISKELFRWHKEVDRDLPWKETKDPFHIWLSEIILQQTRVEQGRPYYLKFIERFANVSELATCSEEELMKLWQGLGYYSRARNLHKAAKLIHERGGKFPNTYEGLLELPGVGPYTAAAIGSFAFDLATPVIDGNVNRVISRLFGITDGIDTKEGQAAIKSALDGIFDFKSPAEFNQAIMDFGALQCVPKNPTCSTCPIQEACQAYHLDMVSELPLKVKKIKKKHRLIRYAMVFHKDTLVLKKRVGKDIWQHLHDFLEVENEAEIFKHGSIEINGEVVRIDGPYKHILTHRNLEIYFHVIEAQALKFKNGSPYFLVERKNLRKFAFPKIIDWYLSEKSIY